MDAKTVLIIGGSSGIGLEIARRCLDEGAKVCVASHTQRKLEAAQAALGSKLSIELVDVEAEATIKALMERVGAVDHVVFCAEAVDRGPFSTLPIASARKNFEVKFWGSYCVARYMRINPGGSLTLFSGTISRMPFHRMTPVGIINAALGALTRGLACELAPLRVNCVSPGTIDTPAWLHIPEEARARLFEHARATLPLRRVGDSQDVASAALMLMKNGFITGVVLDVDGGGLLGSSAFGP